MERTAEFSPTHNDSSNVGFNIRKHQTDYEDEAEDYHLSDIKERLKRIDSL